MSYTIIINQWASTVANTIRPHEKETHKWGKVLTNVKGNANMWTKKLSMTTRSLVVTVRNHTLGRLVARPFIVRMKEHQYVVKT